MSNKKAKTLLEIQDDLYSIYQKLESYCIENETDEIPSELFSCLEIQEQELERKLSSYILFFKQLNGEYEYYKDLKVLLDKKVKAIKRRADWAAQRVEEAIISFGDINEKGTYSIDLDLIKISLVPSIRTIIKDPNTLPESCIEVKEVIKVNSKKVKELLSSGFVLEGAELKQTYSLRAGNVALKPK